MKKSFLPYAMAFMLLPHLLISQNLVDINPITPVKAGDPPKSTVKKSPKNETPIDFLQHFELVDVDKNGLKLIASFVKKVDFEVKIFNNKGLNIYKETFETDDLSLAMGFSNLPEGTFFISLKTIDGEIVRPIKE